MTYNQLRRPGIGILSFKKRCDVIDVHGPTFENCSPSHAASGQRELVAGFEARQRTVLGYHSQFATYKPIDLRIDGVTKTSCRRCN